MSGKAVGRDIFYSPAAHRAEEAEGVLHVTLAVAGVQSSLPQDSLSCDGLAHSVDGSFQAGWNAAIYRVSQSSLGGETGFLGLVSSLLLLCP